MTTTFIAIRPEVKWHNIFYHVRHEENGRIEVDTMEEFFTQIEEIAQQQIIEELGIAVTDVIVSDFEVYPSNTHSTPILMVCTFKLIELQTNSKSEWNRHKLKHPELIFRIEE